MNEELLQKKMNLNIKNFKEEISKKVFLQEGNK